MRKEEGRSRAVAVKKTSCAATRERRHGACGRHEADEAVSAIGDNNIAGGIVMRCAGAIEGRRCADAVCPRGGAGPCERCNDTSARNEAELVRAIVGYDYYVGGADSNAVRFAKGGNRPGAVRRSQRASSGE